jgi:hypothetical protein
MEAAAADCAATAKAKATPALHVDDMDPPSETDFFVDLTNRFRAQLGWYRVPALSSGTGTILRVR